MQEIFGNVTVTYEENEAKLECVRPEDAKILELVEAGYDCRYGDESSWPVLYHLSHLRANLTGWLPIQCGETVLEFGADSGQLTAGFLQKAKKVVCIEKSVSRSRILAKRHSSAENLEVYAGDPWKCLEEQQQTFDWIIAPGILAEAVQYFRSEQPQAEAVEFLRKSLKPHGNLVLV